MKAGDRQLPMSFTCPAQLKQGIEEIAASEGISTSDVVRRAVMSDLRRRKQETVDGAA